MAVLEMLKGLPGSGKSTYAKAKVAANPKNWTRVNKDDLREMMHAGVWKGRDTEDVILATRDSIISASLAAGRNVIVDDTNFAPEHEQRLRELASANRATFLLNESFLAVPVKQCIKNDLKRPNSVGHKVINKMYIKYLSTPWEAPEFNPELPYCIIVDIDGTLAHMAGRSPYDYSMVHTDVVDPTIRLLVHEAWERGDAVIMLSGRDSECRQMTIDWLEEQISYTDLFMRAEGDPRDDALVKHELYEANVKPFYNVRYVLDDRDRVVDMWRVCGLKCLQVGEGDF